VNYPLLPSPKILFAYLDKKQEKKYVTNSCQIEVKNFELIERTKFLGNKIHNVIQIFFHKKLFPFLDNNNKKKSLTLV